MRIKGIKIWIHYELLTQFKIMEQHVSIKGNLEIKLIEIMRRRLSFEF